MESSVCVKVGFSLAFCFYGAVLLSTSNAIPGDYVTFNVLKNKRLSPVNALENLTNIMSDEACKLKCIENELCESFSVSELERRCQLHPLKLGSQSVINHGYKLYIRKKPESEGYFVYDAMYIKPVYDSVPFAQAKTICEMMTGVLVPVKSDGLNTLLFDLMTSHNTWEAYIGITDEEIEDEWKYLDGKPITYSTWSHDGKWDRRDRNCAVLRLNMLWYHVSCLLERPFFCQVPMF